MTVRGKEAAAILPEPRPDAFAVRLRQLQILKRRSGEKLKPALRVNARERLQLRLHLEQKHQPMRAALVAVFADQAGQVKVARLKVQAGFLTGLPTSTGVGGFAIVHVQLAAARTPQAAIRLLRAFEEKDFIALIEAVEQCGDFIGQVHPRSEAGAADVGKP